MECQEEPEPKFRDQINMRPLFLNHKTQQNVKAEAWNPNPRRRSQEIEEFKASSGLQSKSLLQKYILKNPNFISHTKYLDMQTRMESLGSTFTRFKRRIISINFFLLIHKAIQLL